MTQLTANVLNKPMTWSPSATVLLQRKCACGRHSTGGGECDECTTRKLQKKSRSGAGLSAVPPIVGQVLGSPGAALDTATRMRMEQHFGQDFSAVRVHTDAQAAHSADAIDALAYTVGPNVVFGRGQYAPATGAGQRLMAHELTHVLQQANDHGGSIDTRAAEAEADAMADGLTGSRAGTINVSVGKGQLLRKPKAGVDATAQAIIDAAKDDKTTPDASKRAIDLVWAILKAYYPAEAAKVKEVVFDPSDPGLTTQPLSSASQLGQRCSDDTPNKAPPNVKLPTGSDLLVKMCVGNAFLNQVDGFSRRVLQVGHELQHADQHRAGMGGPKNKNKREFQAYAWEALQEEKVGTGKMSFSTRLSLVDCALSILLCMSDADQAANAATKADLLKKRGEVDGKAGNPKTDPPSSCGPHPQGCSGDFSAPAKSSNAKEP